MWKREDAGMPRFPLPLNRSFPSAEAEAILGRRVGDCSCFQRVGHVNWFWVGFTRYRKSLTITQLLPLGNTAYIWTEWYVHVNVVVSGMDLDQDGPVQSEHIYSV